MIVYHFLKAHDALDNIANKRIKLSEFDEVNDPFELMCVAGVDRATRAEMQRVKNVISSNNLLLCFCKTWRNPVLWSHYAEKHRGICLGFDVKRGKLEAVRYEQDRQRPLRPITKDSVMMITYTKYIDWHYEEEWRGLFQRGERDSGTQLYFYPFDELMKLRVVIAGSLCTTTKQEIEEALGEHRNEVRIVKARLAFKTYEVVNDRTGFR